MKFAICALATLVVAAQAADLGNKTETLVQGMRAKGYDILQYAPPLGSGLQADAVTTAAALTGAAFDPATADWSKIYTGFPQSQTPTITLNGPNSNVPIFPEVGGIKCLSDFAICAFANCTVSFASNPPVAECGCLPVRGGNVNLPNRPNGFPVPDPYNLATAAVILDKKAKVPSVKLCNDTSVCFQTQNYNIAPFCKDMQPTLLGTGVGKPAMFGGRFDIISTYNAFAWLAGDTTQPNQGSPSNPTQCTQGGAFAYCETAGCLNKTSWNGLPLTCYCPIYNVAAGTPFFVAGAGASCAGTSVGGKLQFLQNGGFGPQINP